MFADLLKFLHNQRDFILIVKVIVTFPATSVFKNEKKKNVNYQNIKNTR